MPQKTRKPKRYRYINELVLNPNRENFKKALAAHVPYYFHPNKLEIGRRLLEEIPFSYEAAIWWQKKSAEISYDAKWIPKRVKTLIIGGEFDAIVPFSLFEKDARFDRENIQKVLIKNAGHIPWIEEPQKTTEIIKKFEAAL